jgi:hypothetical protein
MVPGSNLGSDTKYSQDFPGSPWILNTGITASFSIISPSFSTVYNRKKKKKKKNTIEMEKSCGTSSFCRGVNEICGLQRFHAA